MKRVDLAYKRIMWGTATTSDYVVLYIYAAFKLLTYLLCLVATVAIIAFVVKLVMAL